MKKKLTKKQIIIICIASITFLAVLATSIAVPLILINENTGIPAPYIEDFDQINDTYVTVKWNKVSKATSYNLQYCYGNIINEKDSIISVDTAGLYHRIEREKGVLAYRVKCNATNNNEYSEWQYFDVMALKLGLTSNITLNSDGILSWKSVKYLENETSKPIPTYIVDLNVSGNLFDNPISSPHTKSITSSLDIKDYISYVIIYDKEEEEWSDVTLTVKIKCLNYYDDGILSTTDGYEFLYKAYDVSEYYEQVITIDKNLYENIIL